MSVGIDDVRLCEMLPINLRHEEQRLYTRGAGLLDAPLQLAIHREVDFSTTVGTRGFDLDHQVLFT